MKQTLIVLSALILLLTLNKGNKEKDLIIPNDSIRLRVIASSNDEIDIKQKQELKSYLESELMKLTKSIETKEEVDKIIVENIEVINNKTSEFLGHNNFKVDYGLNYFPPKTYKGVVYEAGIYDSLVVTLGDGLGKNWWCTLFPPLCLLEDNTTTNNVEYKLFISSIIDKYK